ncbi:hypothetical protein D3C75_372450 [compost metagenome]
MDTAGIGKDNSALLKLLKRQLLNACRPGLQPAQRRIGLQQCVTDAFAPADYDFRAGQLIQIRVFGVSDRKGITRGGGENSLLLL